MRRWLLLLLTALPSLAPAAPPDAAARVQRVRVLLARADSLLAADRPEAVPPLLSPLLDDDLMGGEVLWPLEQRVGLALQRLGRPREALPHLERAVLWQQTDATNHRNLAQLLLELGRRGRAYAEFRDACRLAPDDWRVRVEFAHVLLDYGQLSRARGVLEEAEELDPDAPAVRRALARLHLAADEPVLAVPHLEFLLARAPSDEVRKQLAIASLGAGEPARARELLLPRWPDGLDAEERRVVLEADRRLGDVARARSLAGSSLDGGGWEDPDLWALAALVCYDGGADGAGLRLIDRAIALAPREADYRNNRVALLLRLGRRAEADREWAVVLDLDPSLAGNRVETGSEGDRH